MKPRRTPLSTTVFRLPGGTEDNDLWVTEYGSEKGGRAIGSVWELTPEGRAEVYAGANVELVVFGGSQPPVTLRTTIVPLGRSVA